MRMRSHLVTLVVAVLMPMIVFAGIVLVALGRQQRAAVEHGAMETARAPTNAVDEGLSSDTGDLRAFHVEARRIAATQPGWFSVILFTPGGQQLLNTLREFGEPLPRTVEPASLEAVVATRAPAVGDVTLGQVVRPAAAAKDIRLRSALDPHVGPVSGDPDRLQQVVWKILSEWRPHVLVSDIEMPGEDGYSLISKVRARPDVDGGRTPAIALPAYGRQQDRARSLSAGFSMHVPKPVGPGRVHRHRGDPRLRLELIYY